MRIPLLYRGQAPAISFEFFPPKTAEAEETLFRETVPALKELGPAFISVTYGAGGSTRDTTLRVVERVRREHQLESMAHLTCVGSTRDMLGSFLDEAVNRGIENILALRGDPPRGQAAFEPEPGGFARAVELVQFVKSRDAFAIGAACYPEGHIECADRQLDWDRTAAKVAAGAEFLLSQLFYDAEDFLALRDYLRTRHGIQVPVVPGILPFLSAEQIKRFTTLCGAKLPAPLLAKIDRYAGDDESIRQLGIDVCTELCRTLLNHGVPGIHFYCLNRAASCSAILRNLGLAGKNAQR